MSPVTNDSLRMVKWSEGAIASDEETVAELWFVHDLAALLINTGQQPITKAKRQLGLISTDQRQYNILAVHICSESIPGVVLGITTLSMFDASGVRLRSLMKQTPFINERERERTLFATQ